MARLSPYQQQQTVLRCALNSARRRDHESSESSELRVQQTRLRIIAHTADSYMNWLAVAVSEIIEYNLIAGHFIHSLNRAHAAHKYTRASVQLNRMSRLLRSFGRHFQITEMNE